MSKAAGQFVIWLRALWRPGNRKALACVGTAAALTAYAVHSGATFDAYAERVTYVLGIFVGGHVLQRSKLAQPETADQGVKK